jgi:hypothetical protein
VLSADRHLVERLAAVTKWRAQDCDREAFQIGRARRPKPPVDERPRRERLESAISRWRGIRLAEGELRSPDVSATASRAAPAGAG